VPIIDYAQNARRIQDRVFADQTISGRNKALLKDFLVAYNVSPARLAIFLTRITHLLRATRDISQFIHDREEINRLFFDLRQQYRPATYATIVKVSRRFSRWLNDGEIPKAFRDIKCPPKAKMLRDLNPNDMVTWEEGLLMARATTSLQIQSATLTQLDGGFRPSEFVDQNYGDVSVEGRVVVINVNGKTGKRAVVLHRSVPYFLRWYEQHPTKKASDPLWIAECSSHAAAVPGVRRYKYDALSKRIEELGRRIGIEKPLDFYNLRHSSCVLDKLDNLPVDLAAQRHGHSVKHFAEVYGRLSTQDLAVRFRKHYGLGGQVKEAPQNIVCYSCGRENVPDAAHCFQCAAPLKSHTVQTGPDDAYSRIATLTAQLDLAAIRTKELEQNLANQNQLLEQRLRQMKDHLMDMAIREINEKLRHAA
jgi:integrase